MRDWFTDEDFWISTFPFMFPEDRFEAAEDQVVSIMDLTGVTKGTVLDLCSGPGRHSVALAKAGFKVTGVDRTPFLMDKAKERAAAAGVEVEWVLEDMRNFRRPAAFDLVINMFTSFGYFDDKDDDIGVLTNICDSLKPGGVFFIDVMGKERLAKIFNPSSIDELDDGTLLIQRREICDDWTRICNEWILVKNNQSKSYKLHHTVYSGQELKDRLQQVGFGRVKLFGDFEGNPYGTDAIRLMAAAYKD